MNSHGIKTVTVFIGKFEEEFERKCKKERHKRMGGMQEKAICE